MTTWQVIERYKLGELTKVAQGGQGVVYRAPNVKTKFAPSMVFKEYKPQLRTQIDFSAMAAMPALVEDSLSHPEAERLISMAAWPCALIEDAGTPTGFIMPAIPDDFYISLTTVKGVSTTTAEFQHLLNHPSVLDARGIEIDDAQRYSLLREVALALMFLHNHRVCVGDISPKNLLYSLAPRVAVYFIDCDAMRINGVSALPQLQTPGWAALSGEELATVHSDTYKLGLLALRLLVGDQDTRNPRQLPLTTPKTLQQIIADTLQRPPRGRPSLDAWRYVLGQSIEHARHHPKGSTANVISAAEPPPTPVVHSRPSAKSPLSRRTVQPSQPRAQTSSSSARNLTPLYAVITAAVVAVIIALILLNAVGEKPHSTTTSATSDSPATETAATFAPASSTPGAPGQITYSVTGTAAPYDQITISYTDGSGTRRIVQNVYIPWTITLTPISQSGIGSIEATSLLRLSRLNCKITTSDGKVLADDETNQPQATCG